MLSVRTGAAMDRFGTRVSASAHRFDTLFAGTPIWPMISNPWKNTTVVVTAALLALASLFVSVVMSLRLQERIGTVQAARDLRRQFFLLGTALREAEAAQRMFIITGDEAHFAPFSGVEETLPDRWKGLLAAAAAVPDIDLDLPMLKEETAQVMASLDATAQLRRSAGREAGMRRVEAGESNKQLVAMHMKLGALTEQMEQRIEEQTRSLARAEGRGRAASVGTGLVALALGALGVWQWRSSLGHYRRELELDGEKQRAQQMAQDKGRFLAAMSHEVRTPLNAILGMSEQLQISLPPGPLAEQAEAISVAGRGMLRLVNDLLDLSRLEAGRLELRPSAVLVEAELDWLRRLLGPQAAALGVRLEVSAAADLPATLLLDEGRFRQIIMNLGGNALKFTPSGGSVWIKLERAESADGPELVVEVKDTGAGIPPELHSGIFQPYVQGLAKRSGGSDSGAGLGLAIVRELVELMGGDISLQSRTGEGATFRVLLPLRPASSSSSSASESPALVRVVDGGNQPASWPDSNSCTAHVVLSRDATGRLQRILQHEYPPAAATHSTADVQRLADAMKGLAKDTGCVALEQEADALRIASASFALQALSSALDSLPRRLAPLMPKPEPIQAHHDNP